ncbi:MAG TPA: hypothetical protein P5219_08270, partial [Aminivibrio sp.]|nr:hypothetical protein [Aminivibrio sp.]
DLNSMHKIHSGTKSVNGELTPCYETVILSPLKRDRDRASGKRNVILSLHSTDDEERCFLEPKKKRRGHKETLSDAAVIF